MPKHVGPDVSPGVSTLLEILGTRLQRNRAVSYTVSTLLEILVKRSGSKRYYDSKLQFQPFLRF